MNVIKCLLLLIVFLSCKTKPTSEASTIKNKGQEIKNIFKAYNKVELDENKNMFLSLISEVVDKSSPEDLSLEIKKFVTADDIKEHESYRIFNKKWSELNNTEKKELAGSISLIGAGGILVFGAIALSHNAVKKMKIISNSGMAHFDNIHSDFIRLRDLRLRELSQAYDDNMLENGYTTFIKKRLERNLKKDDILREIASAEIMAEKLENAAGIFKQLGYTKEFNIIKGNTPPDWGEVFAGGKKNLLEVLNRIPDTQKGYSGTNLGRSGEVFFDAAINKPLSKVEFIQKIKLGGGVAIGSIALGAIIAGTVIGIQSKNKNAKKTSGELHLIGSQLDVDPKINAQINLFNSLALIERNIWLASLKP